MEQTLIQSIQPQTIAEVADVLSFVSTGTGALIVGAIIWLVRRHIEGNDRLHDRIDELEKAVLELEIRDEIEQTVFTSRKTPRRP